MKGFAAFLVLSLLRHPAEDPPGLMARAHLWGQITGKRHFTIQIGASSIMLRKIESIPALGPWLTIWNKTRCTIPPGGL